MNFSERERDVQHRLVDPIHIPQVKHTDVVMLPLWAFCIVCVLTIIPLVFGVYGSIVTTHRRWKEPVLLRAPGSFASKIAEGEAM